MSLDALAAAIAERAHQEHASWDAAAFAHHVEKARAIADAKVAAAYLEVAREGVALGWLGVPDGRGPRSLLEACLDPAELGKHAPLRAIELLARAFNLADGLSREPAWMQAYVLARRAEIAGLDALEPALESFLQPVLSGGETSTFTRDHAVAIVDTRAHDDLFLPGEMHAVAPMILAVRDRRRDVTLGLVLRHDRKSAILGPMGEAAPYTDGERPRVRVEGSTLELNGAHVELPLLVTPRTHAIAPAGFVVVSAACSQRLWVVESR